MSLTDRRVRVRPNGLARRLGRATQAAMVTVCAVACALLAAFPSSPDAPGWLSVTLGLMFIGAIALAAAAGLTQLWCWFVPRTAGAFAVEGGEMKVARRWSTRRVLSDEITAGWTTHGAAGPEVELALRSGDVVSTTVADDHEGHAVLDAAGVDLARRVLEMRPGGALHNLMIVLGAMVPGACVASLVALGLDRFLHLPSDALGFLIFTLMALNAPLSLWALGPATVRVGRDGVSVTARGRSRFTPFETIASVALRPTSIVLTLHDGTVRTIATPGTEAARRQGLHDRIAEGLREFRRPRDLSARLAALDRNDRPLGEWRAALDMIARDRDGYRHASLSRGELAAALEDPQSPPDRRVAAAYALAALDRPQAQERVRVALDTVANEPVRVALARAAEGELDESAAAWGMGSGEWGMGNGEAGRRPRDKGSHGA